ncbi:MAG: diguanylate cyclase [Chloroflexota bacterium]|nr:diguanylate cyclase [Chloroflexota bacterium]
MNHPQALLTDPLTGLFSRSVFTDKTKEEYERANRYHLPFAILLLDLDHFKSVNDAFGHSRGDQVLVEFAHRAQTIARASDFIFRYGGDEFVLLLPHTNRIEATALAQRLLDVVKVSSFQGEPALSVTISVGVAAFPEDGETLESIFEAADRRNYAAKRAGRACVIAHDPGPKTGQRLEQPSRVLERDHALEQLQAFLGTLPNHARGLLLVRGLEGVGHTRFLEETSKAVHLRGYAKLHLQGRSALKTRYYGVLNVALANEPQLPNTIQGEATLIQSLATWVETKNYAGLVIMVDNPIDLDNATQAFLTQLAASDQIAHLAFCYAGRGSEALANRPFNISLLETVNLTALSEAAVQIWLRHALQWEAPTSLVNWFYQQTQGLPALIRLGLEGLVSQGKLQPGSAGWEWLDQKLQFPLAEWLTQQRVRRPNNLPLGLPELVGREEELQRLGHLLTEHRLVSLVGSGGMGKSRLALQVGLETLDNYRDGVFFVALAAIDTNEDILLSTILTTLGLKLASANLWEQLLKYLQTKEMLLVLDNFEHLLEQSGLLVRLLEQAPNLKLLITTREELKLRAEAILELRGLEYPPKGMENAISAYSAMQLFVESANPTNFSFSLDKETAPEIARICRVVQGMPLGLKLAAAWVGIFSITEIAERLEQRALELIGQGAGQAGVGTVFDSFWELLATSEQAMLAGLAVFRGGFRREAATAVSQASIFFLEALVHRAFLSRGEQGHYELHELLRQYLTEKLGSERTAREARHADYYLTLAEKSEPELKGANQATLLNLLEAEHHNLRTALEWYYSQTKIEEALRLASALERFWFVRGYLKEGQYYLDWGLNKEAEVSNLVKARALQVRGLLAFTQGDYIIATSYLRLSLKIAEIIGDKITIAYNLHFLGNIAIQQGDYVTANNYLLRNLAIRREVGDKSGIAPALGILGLLAMYQSDYDTAKEYQLQSLAIMQEIGNTMGIADSLNYLGNITLAQGDYTAARDYFQRDLEIYRELGHKTGIAGNLYNLGFVALCQSDYLTTCKYFHESLQIRRKINMSMVCSLSGWLILVARLGQLKEPPERQKYLLKAVSLAGALQQLLKATGSIIGKLEDRLYQEVMEVASTELGKAAFEAAFSGGAAMTTDQALDYAMQP